MNMGKKLIEVALPLEAINRASVKEKSIRHGHPSTLHLWWARRPLAACRAVLFASIIDDPSVHPDRFPTEEAQDIERRRLFDIIEELVEWENSSSEAARAELLRSTDGNLPPVLDPFCGGGSIPFEAQRLGLEAHGTDLNPVAVLITKALIEIPPKFSNTPSVHPLTGNRLMAREWKGSHGLAEDIRYYGNWMRQEAQRRIGHLYPKVLLPKEYGGGEGIVIAWLWARTVTCPNPACGARMPLVRSFILSARKGKEAWVEPLVDNNAKTVEFRVRHGKGGAREGTINRRGGTCIVCGIPVPFIYIRAEGKAKRITPKLMAIVAEARHERIYLSPSDEHASVAGQAVPEYEPNFPLPNNPRDFKTPNYGMDTFADLFTRRQLVALTTFSDLVAEAREQVQHAAAEAGLRPDGIPLYRGGVGAEAYADAVATYLAFAVDKMIDTNTVLCTWQTDPPRLRATFGRQALPMTWDYAEANIFGDAAGDFQRCIGSLSEVLERLQSGRSGEAKQRDATSAEIDVAYPLISTDPPYYDNIGYADLSDFFYIWLRRALNKVHPDLFSTVLVPKTQELVATPYRFGGSKEKAQTFFESGLGQAFAQMRRAQHPEYPLTIYYAFKQSETDEGDASSSASATASTGWETMLEGLLKAGFVITGTWPMRSELTTRNVGRDANALTSSIILVCRPRRDDAPVTTRREFLNALKRELPEALKTLQHGNIAPVDLAQAAIGPGMAIFSRYSKVLESDGLPMRVRIALQLINQSLDQVLAEQEGDYDADTRWAIAWFDQYAHDEGPYGVAETLSKAKNTSITGLVEAGFLSSRSGKVRLLRRDELAGDWDPTTDHRLTVWEVAQHLIYSLDQGGELAAAALLRKVGAIGEIARDLAYRLYTTCERKGWAQDALAYNSLVVAWPELSRLASQPVADEQTTFLR